jgi:hypothetical protein
MDETPEGRRPPPEERIERIEVVERDRPTTVRVEAERGGGVPMWAWLLPLVLVVIVLAWFIFTQGEPRSPLERGTQVEITTPPATETEIRLPTVELPPAPQPAPPAAEPTAAPEATAPMETEPAAVPE